MAVIEVEHLSKQFGTKVLAVDDVSFAVDAGHGLRGFWARTGRARPPHCACSSTSSILPAEPYES